MTAQVAPPAALSIQFQPPPGCGPVPKEDMEEPNTHGPIDVEMHRLLFRSFRYQEAEGPAEVWGHLRFLSWAWLRPDWNTEEKMLELLVLEQFLSILPQEIQSWMGGCCPQSREQAVALVEAFQLAKQEAGIRQQQEELVTWKEEAIWSSGAEQDPGKGEICKEIKEENKEEILVLPAGFTIPRPAEISQMEPRVPDLQGSEGREIPIITCTAGAGTDKGTPQWEGRVAAEPHGTSQSPKQDSPEEERSAGGDDHKPQGTHMGQKPCKCPDCGKSFRWKSALLHHRRSHTGEKPHRCVECGQSFGQKSTLTRHLRIHTGERPYQCPQCGKSFRQKYSLSQHQMTHRQERPYKCTECGESFTLKSYLVRHLVKRHMGQKPYECLDCGKQFAWSSELMKHQTTHTGECLCGSTQRLNLLAHQTTRVNERCYKRPNSEKSFSWRLALVQHRKTHMGRKPYECTECEQGFGQKPSLTRHLRIHNGERPDEITKCGKNLTQTSNLVQHLVKGHRGEKHDAANVISDSLDLALQ